MIKAPNMANDKDKLIDEIEWARLLGKIGAKKAHFSSLDTERQKIHKELTEGRGVEWSQVQALRETWRSDDPFIDVDGNPFVLYIYDQSGLKYRRSSRYEIREYKYHFSWCTTLEKMTKYGRRARYKAKYDVENDTFSVLSNNDEVKKVMHVCKNCLTKSSYLNYTEVNQGERGLIYNDFNIAHFFSLKSPSDLLRPTHQFYSGKYTKDWANVSRQTREVRGGTCEKCRSVNKLHVHHINGVKDDNRNCNLEVLCYDCHIKQPFHSHMRPID